MHVEGGSNGEQDVLDTVNVVDDGDEALGSLERVETGTDGSLRPPRALHLLPTVVRIAETVKKM